MCFQVRKELLPVERESVLNVVVHVGHSLLLVKLVADKEWKHKATNVNHVAQQNRVLIGNRQLSIIAPLDIE